MRGLATKLLALSRTSLVVVIFAVPLALPLSAVTGGDGFRSNAAARAASAPSSFEVWVIDQSDTTADGRFTAVTLRGGGLLVVDSRATPMAIVADRAANRIIVIGVAADEVVAEIDLVSELSADASPDLIDVSPDGGWVFMALRGPTPLTANNPDVNNAVGSTPGLGVMRVGPDGRSGALVGMAPITHFGADGTEIADPHGLTVRSL